MPEWVIPVAVVCFPFYVYLCAKLAGRAWFNEKHYFNSRFMNSLHKETE